MHKHRRLRTLALVVLLGLPGGCGLPHPRHPDRPEITFAAAPLLLSVGRVEAESRYRPPLAAPNVEHLFPVSLAGNARLWGETRLKAGADLKDPDDGARTARFTVERAEAVAGPDGLIHARLMARVEITSAPGRSLGTATAEVAAEAVIAQGLEPTARMDAEQALTQTLLARFDAAMTAAIRARLGDFLK
jgi:hypothetical protein